MTQHTTVHGITVALITEEQIGQAMDNIMADWPKGQYQQLRRYVKDTLHDCAVLAGHYEDAARLRASPWRPIESAPRDGTKFLAFWPHWCANTPTTAWRDTGRNCWDCDARCSDLDITPPVAWMPLPDAPSSSPSQLDHSNGSARHNGQSETASAVHAKAMHKLAANLICPPAADDDADQRARKAGIGA